MHKRLFFGLALDEATAALLESFAESAFDGNRSMAARRLIREALSARGLLAEGAHHA